MRWRAQQAEVAEGEFDPTEFMTTGDASRDPEGIRVINLHYRQESEVIVLPLAIDPDGLEVDVAVKTSTPFLSVLRMRKLGDMAWNAITDSIATSWQIPYTEFPGGTFLNVELEVTVPTGKPREIPVNLWWNLPGTI